MRKSIPLARSQDVHTWGQGSISARRRARMPRLPSSNGPVKPSGPPAQPGSEQQRPDDGKKQSRRKAKPHFESTWSSNQSVLQAYTVFNTNNFQRGRIPLLHRAGTPAAEKSCQKQASESSFRSEPSLPVSSTLYLFPNWQLWTVHGKHRCPSTVLYPRLAFSF